MGNSEVLTRPDSPAGNKLTFYRSGFDVASRIAAAVDGQLFGRTDAVSAELKMDPCLSWWLLSFKNSTRMHR